MRKDITVLSPQSTDAWSTLAKVEFYAGRAAHNPVLLKSARSDADKAMKIEPSDTLNELIQKIDEMLKAQSGCG